MDKLKQLEVEMIRYLEDCFEASKFYSRMREAGLTALDHRGHSDAHDDCHTTISWLERIKELNG